MVVNDSAPRYQLVDPDTGETVGSLYAQADGTLAIQEGANQNEVTVSTSGELSAPTLTAEQSLVDAAGVSHAGELANLSDALTEEEVEDFVAGLLVGGVNISVNYDDANNTLTVDTSALNTEEVEDAVNTLLTAGSGITLTYDDAGDSLTIAGLQASDVTSANWGDYELQKDGTDGAGIINFKTQ